MLNKDFINILQCLKCSSDKLEYSDELSTIHCKSCNETYYVKNSVPVFLKYNTTGKSSEENQFNYLEHYTIDAEEYDYFEEHTGETAHIERRIREYIKSEITAKKGLILDVGSGGAWVAENFCKEGFHVCSLDISLKNTSQALQKNPFPNHFAIVADALNLPFKNASVDFVIASEIIEHIVDPKKFIFSLMRVVKPGGSLIVTTPYKEKLKYTLCIHCNKPTPFSAHIHSFDEKKMIQLSDSVNYKYYKFGNKILMHFRTYKILNLLNFKIWKYLDFFINKIFNYPDRILFKWKK